MTMLVATLGLLPAAMSHQIGSDSQRPFAIVIVGGLLASLLMSIFLLPTLYVGVAGDRDVLPEADDESHLRFASAAMGVFGEAQPRIRGARLLRTRPAPCIRRDGERFSQDRRGEYRRGEGNHVPLWGQRNVFG